jgi:hypothetical protein
MLIRWRIGNFRCASEASRSSAKLLIAAG